MRLTINLADDLYQDARSLALAKDVSISAAVNQLLRAAVHPPAPPTDSDIDHLSVGALYFKGPRRIPVVKCQAGLVITDEDVARARSEEDLCYINQFRGVGKP